MTGEKILVIDDDLALSELLGASFRRWGYRTAFCAHGDEATTVFTREAPDLVLLDVMLPGLDGFTVCRHLRAFSAVPIVMLSARGETNDVVAGLESGADDYVVKPFEMAELMARVRARLRLRAHESRERLTLGEVTIDLPAHQVRRGAALIDLTPLEFNLLALLARRPWRVFTREELLAEVWGHQHVSDSRLVNVHVQRLRAKIEPDPDHPRYVVTVRGVGYCAGG